MSSNRLISGDITAALTAARDHVNTARSVARTHARQDAPIWAAHIHDLDNLCQAMEAISYLTRDLANLATALESGIRNRYLGSTSEAPTGRPWPRAVIASAQASGSALMTLRRHVTKTPIDSTHRALAALRADVRHAHHH